MFDIINKCEIKIIQKMATRAILPTTEKIMIINARVQAKHNHKFGKLFLSKGNDKIVMSKTLIIYHFFHTCTMKFKF